MTTSFKREAEAVLREGGYELERVGDSGYGKWRHSTDASRPLISVPVSPGKPDSALMRIRHAVRKGKSTIHGQEQEMARKASNPSTKPLHETLAAHAPPSMQKRVSQIARGTKPDPLSPKDLGDWMRKCIRSHGALPNAEVNLAAEKLHLRPHDLSHARSGAGAVSYRTPDMGRHEYVTDFAGRIPAEAYVAAGRVQGSKNRKPAASPVTITQMPTDPDQERGRPLVGGDLTDEQREKAQEQMRRSTELADQEAAEIRARLDAGYAKGGDVVPVAESAPNGNGRQLTGLEAAVELLVQEALAATHALTDDDIRMLRGTQENLKRLRSDLEGMAAGINLLLQRVDQRDTAAAA